MPNNDWSAVDRYLSHTLMGDDAVMEAVLKANAAAHLPAIDVSPCQGKFLHLMARISNAKKILEIGTLGGYSTIWMARALPKDGKIISLEYDPRHADVARRNVEASGVASLVDIRVGKAIETLPALAAEAPFDFIFIDADKPSNPEYLLWALKLSRPGTVIIGDNVVRAGAVLETEGTDANVKGVQQFLRLQGMEKRLSVTALQTVGVKGWDGFSLAVVD